ncbi:hypothetical protein GCM10011385_30130 [Nitratireductor aestuarii]|uniref:Uncharacterized protein n=1 Tax=Nitratireductor aestuarii TaxID=1735103 RepID=A0A916RXG3_9HYPH|nr:hypothetical protein GCM10011385_30130 [Nitratireductor aestuarii]
MLLAGKWSHFQGISDNYAVKEPDPVPDRVTGGSEDRMGGMFADRSDRLHSGHALVGTGVGTT